ncbi:hypothetical protein J3E73DRAFT_394674 [Bipolaris maydis]|nr:hypothetical protein J3E73DRAFT_394674 [Bipolaris maydis]
MSFFIQHQTHNTRLTREGRYNPTPYQPYHPPCSFAPQVSLGDAQGWLKESAPDLMNEHPTSIVPGIDPNQLFLISKNVKGVYTPKDLWNVRYLSPAERYELYVSFGVFGRTMQSHEPGSPEYTSAFDLIKEMSQEIAQKEAQWYAQFADKRRGTREQQTKRFKDIVVEQMHAVDIRSAPQASSASSSTHVALAGKQPGADNDTAIIIDDEQDSSPRPSRGQKRRAPGPEAGEDCRTAKRVSPELDESAEHQRYLAQKELLTVSTLNGDRSRKSTDPIWQKLAAFDAFEAAKQIPLPKKKRRQSSPEEDEPSWQIETARFQLPSRDLASYPLKTPDRYMCLHVDTGCGGKKDCTCHNHDCCRNGFTLRQLEGAVKRKYKGYKTWENWFSKVMRDRDSTRVKACMPPLEWSMIRAWKDSCQKKPVQKPRSALERLQVRQREEQERQIEEAISQTTQKVVGAAEESGSQGGGQASPAISTEVYEGVSSQIGAEEPILTPGENMAEDHGDEGTDVALFGEPLDEDGNNGSNLKQASGAPQGGLFDASELADILNPAVPVSGDGSDLAALGGRPSNGHLSAGSQGGLFDASEMADIFNPAVPVSGDGFSNDLFEGLF